MRRRIVISYAPSALSDLGGILAWYAEQQVPEVGRRFVAEIVARIGTLAQHPDIGRVVPEFGISVLRELVHPPFCVVYRSDPGRVRVVRVWRSERLLRLD